MNEIPNLKVDGLGVPEILDERPTRNEFYTNYPFFKYWNSENNDKLSVADGINIYVHIPYCIQICDYCFYMKELVKSKQEVNEYIDHLCKEMEMVSDVHNLRRRSVNSIYFGGGTPSVLTEDQLARLMEAIYKFHKVENPEFTFEAEPGTFSDKKLHSYKANGVNRISMGVQSFDDQVIKHSSRKHTAKQAIRAVEMVKEVGGFQLNIDLLSGLAGEEMESWEHSVKTAIGLPIDLLTIYRMKAYANTVFFKKGVQTNEIKLPDDDEEVSFMTRALAMLQDAGYRRWSTFAFTKTGHQHRYAENTWRGQDLVAYGASSFGKIGSVSYQNYNSTKLYFDKVDQNKMPVYRSYGMTVKDQMVKELLLCSSRLSSYSKMEFARKFGFDYFDLIPKLLASLEEGGYIFPNRDELELTERGILFGDFVGRMIAASFKDALGKDEIGFSY